MWWKKSRWVQQYNRLRSIKPHNKNYVVECGPNTKEIEIHMQTIDSCGSVKFFWWSATIVRWGGSKGGRVLLWWLKNCQKSGKKGTIGKKGGKIGKRGKIRNKRQKLGRFFHLPSPEWQGWLCYWVEAQMYFCFYGISYFRNVFKYLPPLLQVPILVLHCQLKKRCALSPLAMLFALQF